MSDQGPDDPIDYSGTPRSLGEKRDYGFQVMRARMLEVYAAKLKHVNPLVRGAKLEAYNQALNDAFSVFAQIVEVPTDEELTAG
jgi:hypothetical protein